MDALKDWYNEEFYRELTQIIAECYPPFQAESFYQTATNNLAALSLKERLRQTAVTCHDYLPADYRQAVHILYEVAPKFGNRFVGMFLPEFVGLYGLNDFAFSMEALKYFTPFFSAEFAIREFLKHDFPRTLGVMIDWSTDDDLHVRRLASEGSRPRLPWSFHLNNLIEDPSPVRPILENLKADPELYVKKSVANHLNDISKDHPGWMLDLVATWDQSQPDTAWIVKRAARSLIKAGHPRSFALFGFEAQPEISVSNFSLIPQTLKLGQTLEFSFDLHSDKAEVQRLVIDYRVYYVKKSGRSQAKVFKLKEIELPGHQQVTISKKQTFRNFTTRVHYPGTHAVELLINGQTMARVDFELEMDDEHTRD